MKFLKLNSNHLESVNISKYKIDWDRKVSAPQKKVSDFLRPFWSGDIVLLEFRIPGSLLRIDILNISKKIAVEVSPDSIHRNFNPFMHKNRSEFLKKLKSDQDKITWCEKSGIFMVELVDSDIETLSVETFSMKGVEL